LKTWEVIMGNDAAMSIPIRETVKADFWYIKDGFAIFANDRKNGMHSNHTLFANVISIKETKNV